MTRDYDAEFQDTPDRKYAYDFDYVLRDYFLQALEPLFREGSALEVGCFEGELTKRLAARFRHLTVVEPAAELIAKACTKVPGSVRFVNSTIEMAEFDSRFDNVFIIHVLEHIDDRVEALRRAGALLSENGRLFVVCPNANAPSRQIAVKMGLIPHNTAVTPDEEKHGHRVTYTLDTLECDALAAGLTITQRGGVFFKPLANFQFDKLLEQKFFSKAFLDGCYALGMVYPDLSASIYLVCERFGPATSHP